MTEFLTGIALTRLAFSLHRSPLSDPSLTATTLPVSLSCLSLRFWPAPAPEPLELALAPTPVTSPLREGAAPLTAVKPSRCLSPSSDPDRTAEIAGYRFVPARLVSGPIGQSPVPLAPARPVSLPPRPRSLIALAHWTVRARARVCALAADLFSTVDLRSDGRESPIPLRVVILLKRPSV